MRRFRLKTRTEYLSMRKLSVDALLRQNGSQCERIILQNECIRNAYSLLSAIKKLRSDQGGHPQFLFILCTVFGRCTVKNRSTAMSCIFLTLRVVLFAENLLNRITSGRYFFLSLFVGGIFLLHRPHQRRV